MQMFVSKKVALFSARAFSMGLLVSAPLNQVQAQPNGGVVVPTEVHRVVIDGGGARDIEKLIDALSMPNPTTVSGQMMPIVIELSCGLQLPLTGHHSIAVNSFRSLIASPSCARGPRTPLQRVPRIFVTDNRAGKPLFLIGGDHVGISGFRLEGPTKGIGAGEDRLERGLKIHPAESPDDPIRNIEISNMEIFHWSGAGIDVVDNTTRLERGRLFNTNERAVTIKNNFIHSNQHGAGFGYGVVTGKGAYTLISQNVFDENRHGVAGDSVDDKGKDYSGYTLRDNLILPGGGEHCVESAWGFFMCFWQCNCWQTHQIDMHGDKNRFYSSSNWQCGTAGETIIIERNTIFYDAGLAIKIRGNPADKGIFDGNVFKHSSKGKAIQQNGECGWGDNITNPIDIRPNNIFGVNPSAELGRCDFAGDGRKDEFMATGATWWAKSPITGQWRYLNTMPERLQQLQLEDIDGDGKCDVAERPPRTEMLPRRYSKSGTGPWVSRQIGVNPN